MAKQVNAVDLKSAVPKGTWGFDSPSRYNSKALLEIKGQNRNKINYDKMISIFGDRTESINKFKYKVLDYVICKPVIQ